MNGEASREQENEVERLVEAYFLRCIDDVDKEEKADSCPPAVNRGSVQENSDLSSCDSDEESLRDSEAIVASSEDSLSDEHSLLKESDLSKSEVDEQQEPSFVVKLKKKYAEKNLRFDASEFIRKRQPSMGDWKQPQSSDEEVQPSKQNEKEAPRLLSPSEFARKNYEVIGLRDITYQAIRRNENIGAPLSNQLGKLFSSYFKERNRKIRYTEEDKPMHPIFKEKTVLLQEYRALKKVNFSKIYQEVFEEMKKKDLKPPVTSEGDDEETGYDLIDSDSAEALNAELATAEDATIQKLREELLSFLVFNEEDLSD